MWGPQHTISRKASERMGINEWDRATCTKAWCLLLWACSPTRCTCNHMILLLHHTAHSLQNPPPFITTISWKHSGLFFPHFPNSMHNIYINSNFERSHLKFCSFQLNKTWHSHINYIISYVLQGSWWLAHVSE